MAYIDPQSDPGWEFLRQRDEEALKDQMKAYDSKKNCWIPDSTEGFLAAEIKSTKGDMVTVMTVKGNEVTLKKELVQEMNPPKFEKTEDMANLTFLNEASVLHNLRQRYYSMLIYTYSGLFCVVINPYKRLPIYTESVIKMYMGKRRNEMPPHLFSVSDEAYRNMVQDRANQSMLITGESGAGKTENTKKVIAYFAIVGATQQAGGKVSHSPKQSTLEEQIVMTNPVLEAFGNAKTVRNNNSSRFGKFIRVHFNKSGKLTGGDIEHYLLEKSRVIRQAPGERCFHIFYQMMSGHLPKLRENLKLTKDLRYYHFVSQAELTIDGVDDKQEMKDTDYSFDVMGFEQEEKDNLYKLCAAVMHMGEMKFKQRPREEQAEVDTVEGTLLTMMLKMHAYAKPRVRVGNEWVNKGQNLDQVHWAVGALAKAVYSRMFHWLIQRCNKTLSAEKNAEKAFFIGVLDIAGFEIFDFNSFEQLWINFVNERLQQFFNHHMFVLEQEEYQREGIKWEFIDFGLDLQACIDLLEKPLGIVSMLDEECIVPKATDMTYVQKLNDQHLGKHPNYQKPKPPKGKQAEAHFALVHYAGTVRYNVSNWLEKNKDPLNDTAVSVLKHGEGNQLLLDIWKDYQTQEEAAEIVKAGGQGKKKGKASSFLTVSMMYRESLNNLMNMLNTTHPHFIRCIIPNEQKKSGVIEAGLVLNQLTCNGVLEGIRICRKGFPNRVLYADFKQRYAILASSEAHASDDAKVASEKMVDRLIVDKVFTEEEHRIGQTKVFFKAGVLARLEDQRDQKLASILTGFQAQIRSYLAKVDARRREEQRQAIEAVNNGFRSYEHLLQHRTFDHPTQHSNMAQTSQLALVQTIRQSKALETSLNSEEKTRKDLEEQLAKLIQEKNDLFTQLQSEKGSLNQSEEKIQKLTSQKADLERQLSDMTDRLGTQEDRNSELQKAKKKVESECDNLNRKIQDLELALRKADSEKSSKDNQIRSLQDEMASQDESAAKLNKEKKHQEEINRKLMEDMQAEEDKVNHLNKLKAKLEQQLDDLEDSLEREKRSRQDVDKGKRKVEGDLRVAQENIEELNKQKHDMESNLKKKEQEMQALSSKLEDEQGLVAKMQRQIKELQTRIQELEEELEQERQARSKSEKIRNDLQRQLEELGERLDEAGGTTQAQMELNKKREAELAKLRRDLEEASMNHEGQLGALRKKHNDAVAEMSDQLDQLQKAKAKSDKDKVSIQRELEDLHAAMDQESKGKQDAERFSKQLELQVAELQAKCDEQTRQLHDFSNLKNRINSENADLLRQLEDAESQLNALNRLKLDEAKRTADEETRERHNLAAQLKNMEHENQSLREQLDEEGESKTEMQRHVSKLNAEIQQWKARFESEGLAKVDEIEEAKRKLTQKVQEMQEAFEVANGKIASLEKVRHKLLGEIDDAQVDVERANNYAAQLEKKQKGFDKVVDEWKKKCDDMAAELDASQRENRQLSTECFKLKNSQDELGEQIEALRRENKNLVQEIKDISDQLGEGGRSVHELQKVVRRLELEKEELQQALDEAESALEAEESKVMRAQVEVSQIRQEIEKRIREKEEEFENTRKNHQRALDSMQATLESESKGRAEALRLKKKLESDINELEIALDHANKANADAQKNIKLYQEQVKELQMHIEDEQRQREDIREQFHASEKRCAMLQSEKEEYMTASEQAERTRRQLETELYEGREQVNELSSTNASLSAIKRKLEGEQQALHAELDDTLSEFKKVDEQSKKAMSDAARLAEELRQEQEHSMHVERMRKGLEQQVKEMQIRLDEAEQAALKGGKKIIQKLEQRVSCWNRNWTWNKSLTGCHFDFLPIQKTKLFQLEEDKKNQERMQDLIDKLQQKLKTYKRQIEEAEEVAATNLSKYRQLQQQMEDAEERADIAENSLAKLRAKNRSTTSMGNPGIALSHSVRESASRARMSSNALNE
ncbi:Myosin tail family protein [Trichuris trichiura]|uniref:Myosin tail family protein n=1 Tax=Trichuris trichiura TaxID=36087 RepID=A0A077Z6U9_TRITR|nr:Myosin tail family protein [Trichuris trichiura]